MSLRTLFDIIVISHRTKNWDIMSGGLDKKVEQNVSSDFWHRCKSLGDILRLSPWRPEGQYALLKGRVTAAPLEGVGSKAALTGFRATLCLDQRRYGYLKSLRIVALKLYTIFKWHWMWTQQDKHKNHNMAFFNFLWRTRPNGWSICRDDAWGLRGFGGTNDRRCCMGRWKNNSTQDALYRHW